MAPRHTDRWKAIFLARETVVVVGDCARNGESELIAKMGLSNPEGLGLEFV